MKAADTNGSRGVLFIGQTAGRHGTTMQLLHFLRWYRAHGKRPFSLLLAEGGELVEEYGKCGPTWRADSSHWCPGGIRSKALKRVGLGKMAGRAERADLRKFASSCQPGVIYVNSIATEGVRLIESLDLGVPVVMHSHELEFFLEKQGGPALPKVLSVPARFIACSNAVRANLVQKHGVSPERVEAIHESIPVDQIRATRSRAEILRELGFPEDAPLVVACGELCWVKGADLFIQLAREVRLRRPRACFAWVGPGDNWNVGLFRHDVRVAGLEQSVRLTGAVPNPADYLAAADVFVLTSREDAFPLVCLEAAALGKPIVCFEDSGGEPEFVEDDCGYIVPFLDIQALTERVISLLDSPECRYKLGSAAKRKVAERHDIGGAAQQVMSVIERTISGE